jgi:hypothetical protein
MAEYFTRTPERGVTELYHKSDKKQPVSTIHYSYKPKGLFGGKEKSFQVTNQPYASQQHFQTLDSATAHSVAIHKQSQQPAGQIHPIKRVAHHINQLGDSIEEASRHPSLNEHQQNKLLDISTQFASLVQRFNRHFGA